MSIQFNGFEETMFAFLSHREKDADRIKWIRQRIDAFGAKLLHMGLQALDSSFYRAHHVGVFHPEEDKTFWVAFGITNLERLLNTAHQTVSLSETGLDIYIRVGSQASIGLLRQNLRSREGEFANIVGDLPEPFEVQIKERTPLAPMRFIVGPPVLRLQPNEVRNPASSGFSELVRLLATIRYPHFSLRTHLDKRRAVELGGSGLIVEVLKTMKAFQPLVVFLNEDEAEVRRMEAKIRALQAQIAALGGGTAPGEP
jgi:hypothetical protein